MNLLLMLRVFGSILLYALAVASLALTLQSITRVTGWDVPAHTKALGVTVRVIAVATVLALVVGAAAALYGLAP